MRVIGGTAKGHRLKVPRPRGRTRPVTSLVKEAVFSILEAEATDWSRTLDLYAGTGSLGIEALSRGSEWADFVEEGPRACETIRQNLRLTGLDTSSHVYCCNVSRALAFLEGNYSLIFADPPYSAPSLGMLLEKLGTSNLLAKGALVVIPHSSRSFLSAHYGRLHLHKERRYGDTTLSIYRGEEMG